MYQCPMHPEVKQEAPGKCPICKMDLVKEGEQPVTEKASYKPLFIIFGLIFITSLAVSFPSFDLRTIILTFMTGFFLVFSGFKLMDLKGFAEGYSSYDLLAKRWFAYGYIYPFIELFFGLSMIVSPRSKNLLIAELLVMVFSGVGVAIKVKSKEKFQCACLGTFLKVPLTKITLIEDFGMAFLALVMIMSIVK